jgi:two-component system alkaline phosphatase synthesis response regulator PhoP
MKDKIKLLLVEDEPNILRLTSAMLEKDGYQVLQAQNGREGIDILRSSAPDIVITDLIMPEKNGFEVCRAVRANPGTAKVPILILTAMGDEFNKAAGFEAGADDYLTKPFNILELKSRITALLRRTGRG